VKKPLRNLLPIVKFDGPVLTYAEVRDYFGWKGNATIRRYVREGLLTRFRIGARSKDCRITAESVERLREHINKCIEDEAYAEKARMQTMRERKGLPQRKQEEVLLDAEAIIERFNEGRPSPAKDSTPDTGSTYTAPSQPVRRQRVGFSSVRGI